MAFVDRIKKQNIKISTDIMMYDIIEKLKWSLLPLLPDCQDNKLTGPASLFSATGERIEFEYSDGVVHGPAKIKGGGDMEECCYVNGVKHGKATYYWKAGHKEEFLYEKVMPLLPD